MELGVLYLKYVKFKFMDAFQDIMVKSVLLVARTAAEGPVVEVTVNVSMDAFQGIMEISVIGTAVITVLIAFVITIWAHVGGSSDGSLHIVMKAAALTVYTTNAMKMKTV
ncbi:uncharacterized protein LOC134233507 [Saccostrea cucullata]|uniref:uncharacterized protein LOC134233507 n=1 Tax=Saccostrea cuccullata TaxID=36930 RepID=UPI002ED214BF